MTVQPVRRRRAAVLLLATGAKSASRSTSSRPFLRFGRWIQFNKRLFAPPKDRTSFSLRLQNGVPGIGTKNFCRGRAGLDEGLPFIGTEGDALVAEELSCVA